MLEHTLTVRDRCATVCPRAVVQHGINVDTLRLVTDSEYDGLSKSVVFARCGMDPVEVAYTDRPIRIPWELLETPGELHVLVVGRQLNSDGETVAQQVVSARTKRPLVVVPSGPVTGKAASGDPDNPSSFGLTAVPHIDADGTLTWTWEEQPTELPASVSIIGPSGLSMGRGHPDTADMSDGRVYLDLDALHLYADENNDTDTKE